MKSVFRQQERRRPFRTSLSTVRSASNTTDQDTVSCQRSDGTYQEIEEVCGLHQLAPSACDEVWKRYYLVTLIPCEERRADTWFSHSWLQVNTESPAIWKGQTRHHRWKYSSSQEV